MIYFQGVWNEHKCFRNMGIHFFSFNYDPNQACDETVPFQVVYDAGNLNGFVFQHFAGLDSGRYVRERTQNQQSQLFTNLQFFSSRFEAVTKGAIDAIVDTAPTCIYDVISDPGLSAMHVYIDNYHVSCL